MTQIMATTLITVLKMAIVLSDSSGSIVIEIFRAKHHPTGRLHLTPGSIPWRFGWPGFAVFKSYAGPALGVAPFCG